MRVVDCEIKVIEYLIVVVFIILDEKNKLIKCLVFWNVKKILCDLSFLVTLSVRQSLRLLSALSLVRAQAGEPNIQLSEHILFIYHKHCFGAVIKTATCMQKQSAFHFAFWQSGESETLRI